MDPKAKVKIGYGLGLLCLVVGAFMATLGHAGEVEQNINFKPHQHKATIADGTLKIVKSDVAEAAAWTQGAGTANNGSFHATAPTNTNVKLDLSGDFTMKDSKDTKNDKELKIPLTFKEGVLSGTGKIAVAKGWMFLIGCGLLALSVVFFIGTFMFVSKLKA